MRMETALNQVANFWHTLPASSTIEHRLNCLGFYTETLTEDD